MWSRGDHPVSDPLAAVGQHIFNFRVQSRRAQVAEIAEVAEKAVRVLQAFLHPREQTCLNGEMLNSD